MLLMRRVLLLLSVALLCRGADAQRWRDGAARRRAATDDAAGSDSGENATAPAAATTPLPLLTWAHAFGGSGADEIFDVSLDGRGAILASGYHSQLSLSDNGWGRAAAVAASGASGLRGAEEDAVVFKLSRTGRVAWMATLGGRGGGMAYSVHADVESGEALACGFTTGLGGASATFGAGPLAPVLFSRGSRDAFVVKARVFVCVCARMRQRWELALLTSNAAAAHTRSPMTPRLTPQLSSSGTVLWAVTVGGTYADECNAVTRDPVSGDALLGGFAGNGAPAGDAVRFGPGAAVTRRTAGGPDAFLARVSRDGAVRWAALFGGGGTDMVLAVAADEDGAALATGYFESPTCTFGAGPAAVVLTNAGGSGSAASADAFALKLSAAGTLLWAVALAGPGYDVSWGAAVVPSSGELLVAGSFDGGQLRAGDVELDAPADGMRNGYIAKARRPCLREHKHTPTCIHTPVRVSRRAPPRWTPPASCCGLRR
jgi:hypothetical protein